MHIGTAAAPRLFSLVHAALPRACVRAWWEACCKLASGRVGLHPIHLVVRTGSSALRCLLEPGTQISEQPLAPIIVSVPTLWSPPSPNDKALDGIRSTYLGRDGVLGNACPFRIGFCLSSACVHRQRELGMDDDTG